MIPRIRATIRGRSDGLSWQKQSFNDHPLRLVRPALNPLPQPDQTFGELPLFPTSRNSCSRRVLISYIP